MPSAGARSAAAPGISPTQIVLGATGPLSGSESQYEPVLSGANAYFDYVNAHGGVNGRQIVYKIEDDQYDPSKTALLTSKLVEQDNVFAIFNSHGPVNTYRRMQDRLLNDMLAECCGNLQPLAFSRGIELDCHSPSDVSFRGDEQLLRRLIINLLDNAIRYTPRGGRVSASLETESAGVRLRISDNGIGIASEAVPHVFERFYRTDQARSREAGGFGLGLSIVKWIAESHHGAVELDSRPAAGSTFTVTLPR